MRRIVLIVLLTLAACAGADAAKTVSGSSDPQDWRLPTGKPPSQVEYAALVAACQDKVHEPPDSGAVDSCLSGDFGMHHLQ
ncbi:MAG TPA: hypothetical protein VJ770_23330 [Stellaceae bacterium]|nr:hypothetical protein [Stellaceae bacterium]